MHILFVDDDSLARATVPSVLEAEGHSITVACDGEEALTKLAAASVDLIITDIFMPKLDGLRLRKLVRSIEIMKRLPILFISGSDDVQVVDDPRCEGFYKKGRPVSELIGWVKYLTTPEFQRLSPPAINTQRTIYQRDNSRGLRRSE